MGSLICLLQPKSPRDLARFGRLSRAIPLITGVLPFLAYLLEMFAFFAVFSEIFPKVGSRHLTSPSAFFASDFWLMWGDLALNTVYFNECDDKNDAILL